MRTLVPAPSHGCRGTASKGDAPMMDGPRSLRDEVVRIERRAMLTSPHVAPLAAFAQSLRDAAASGASIVAQVGTGVYEVPDFDPLDGGIGARLLFLFEKPGQ